MKFKLYFITLFIFLGIDAVWLGVVASKFYRAQIGHLMAETPNLPAAGLFYLLFVGALVFFIVGPAIGGEGMRTVILSGALFGLVTYATYDLTNLATLRGWSLLVTTVDLLWGAFLTATTSALSVWLGRKFC
ncbi:MAG: DUF2177 family protein [Anaerolineales bacterium]